MPEDREGGSVGQTSSEGPIDWPPRRIMAAQSQVTYGIWSTLGGLIAILLGCLVMALDALTYVGLVLLIISLVLLWKARQNLVLFSSEGPIDWPPKG